MTPKEYLRQVGAAERRAKALRVEIESLKTSAANLHSPIPQEDPVQISRTTDPPGVKKMDRAMDLESELKESMEQAATIREEVSGRIDSMDFPEERCLLRCRYLSGWEWDDIANTLNVSVRTVYRIHADALDHFPMPS